MSLDAFRTEVRTFFDDTLPGALDGVEGGVARAKVWRALLFDHGLGALDYPEEFGGRGLDREYLDVWAAESTGRIPRENNLFGLGVGMALPTIRDYGNATLKERFLRPGLRGEEVWCQLYSEPGSGSDLASLQTLSLIHI